MSAVLGIVEPDPIGDELGTGYSRFHSPCGVRGLAKASEDRLDILAIFSDDPGSGQFKAFIEGCKSQYSIVCVWLDWNPIVGKILSKWGFRRVIAVDRGEKLEGWRWDQL